MMRLTSICTALACGLISAAACAQTHVVKKTESVVRAVAVYEWTGDEAKPTASRVIPVSLFVDGQFEDAGIYLARPVPLALDAGTIFEGERGGVTAGSLELAYARHFLSNGSASWDDGWLGYGHFKPRPNEPLLAAAKSGPISPVIVSGGNRPHFSNKPEEASTRGAKPDVDRSTAAGAGTTVSAGPAERKRNGDASAASTDPEDDVERPTLKKRTPTEIKANDKKKQTASVQGVRSLNDDPDRPTLHRGAAASGTDEASLPPLHGLPPGMHQMVAVSDASRIDEHDFARGWENTDERTQVQARLEDAARVRLAQYGGAMAKPAPAPSTVPARKSAGRTRRVAPKTVPAPPAADLSDESLRAFTLSYGGAATYVFSASSPGSGGAVRYVSVVAQRDPAGGLKIALSSVTDSAHLDRTPWMRLVDAVDADASNRASLLFELRGQTSREFALYRVIGAKAEQAFVTENP